MMTFGARYLRAWLRVNRRDLGDLADVARRAPGGPSKAEPGADAGPVAPRGAALIIIKANSVARRAEFMPCAWKVRC